MSKIENTRLRFIKTKDPDKLVEYVSRLLPYKIEIKGNPTFAQKKWHLWFILPEKPLLKEMPFGDID